MQKPATETVHNGTAEASSADLAEQELFADPKLAACLDRLTARWSKPRFSVAEPVLKRLGRFEIRRELGRGRFGVVFLAWDPQLQRQVALKVPQFDTTLDVELRERFRGEALAAGKLHQAGIVPVYEVGQHSGIDYLAMAYIEGQTLAERLQNGPLAPAYAARLTIDLATAIQHAHEQGVIHRDLKPSNVLLDKQARPHVTDFGLARRLSDSAMRATATGQVLGTPAYMPPEQATGSTNIGPASDIYSIGVILYESITGRPPFQAATFVEAVEFILNRDPLPPSKLNPKLPLELDAITFKCLEKREEARYASAADLADDLQRYLDGQPIRARTHGPLMRAWRWSRKNPAYALLLVTLCIAFGLLVTTAGVYDRWQHATELAEQQQKIADHQRENAAAQEQIARTQTQIAETERQRAAAERKSATTARYFATVNRARNLINRRLTGWSAASLAEVSHAAAAKSDAADPLELRALAAEALTGVDVQKVAKFPTGMTVGRIAISHDGQLLAVGELKGSAYCRIKIYQLPEQQPKHEFTILNVRNSQRFARGEIKWQDGIRELAFTSDNRYLAAGLRFGTIMCYDLQAPDKPPRQLTISQERELESLAFSADGQTLFALTKDDEFIRWQRWQTDDTYDSPWSDRPRSFAVAPQGHNLFVQHYAADKLWMLDQSLRKRVHFSGNAQLPKASEGRLVTDATGSLLAGKSAQGVRVYETRVGHLVRRLQDDTLVDDDLGFRLAMTADGQILSAFDDDGIVRLFDIHRGRQVLRLDLGRHEFQDLALDPQGKWLTVASDETLVIWQLNRPTVRRMLTSPAVNVEDIRFSTGGILACATNNGGGGGINEFRLLTFGADGAPQKSQSGGFEHSGLFADETQLAWLPDGKQLVWCGKFGARVMNESQPARSGDAWLPLYGDVLPVAWDAVAAAECESIDVRQIPHPDDPERHFTRIVPGGRDVKLKCRLPRTVTPGDHFLTLSLSLRIDCEPSALPVFQLHQRFGERSFPPAGAAPWSVSSANGEFAQWTVELQHQEEFAEFELIVTNLDNVRSLEIERLDYVALARQMHQKPRRFVQQIHFLSIPPQGERIWGCIDEVVHSWSLETGKLQATWQNPNHALSKSANVRCLVAGTQGTLVGTRDGGVHWLHPQTGNSQAVWAGPGKEVVAAALCEEAGCALIAGDNGKVRALQLSGGETLFDLLADDSAIVALAATADGKSLVTAATNRTLKLWRVVLNRQNKPAGYELFCQLPDTMTPVRSLALSPDGKRLAVLTTTTGSVAHWDLPALSSELQRLGIE